MEETGFVFVFLGRGVARRRESGKSGLAKATVSSGGRREQS